MQSEHIISVLLPLAVQLAGTNTHLPRARPPKVKLSTFDNKKKIIYGQWRLEKGMSTCGDALLLAARNASHHLVAHHCVCANLHANAIAVANNADLPILTYLK